MSEFSIGDKVIRVSDTHTYDRRTFDDECDKGSIGVVIEGDGGDGAVGVEWDKPGLCHASWFDADNLVTFTTKGRKHLKPGDRVVLLKKRVKFRDVWGHSAPSMTQPGKGAVGTVRWGADPNGDAIVVWDATGLILSNCSVKRLGIVVHEVSP